MESKKISVAVALVLATAVVGCGTATSPEINSISAKETESVGTEAYSEASEYATEENVAEESTIEESTVEESEPTGREEAGISELTFSDLAKLQFEFSSGAGAWSEEFTIEKDGYFTGLFHDSDMGVTGEGYEDGTRYSSSYSGHFTDLVKINEYTYQMKIADISYEEQVGMEEISDNIRYIYTDSYCLGGTNTFTIYLPQTPINELSEEICMWLRVDKQGEEKLNMIAIADETNGYGIYSYDRLAPLEDAQMMFDSYKDSYDYYGEMLSEAGTTAEMVEYSGTMYELSDECLNYIWNLIRYNVEEDRYSEILAEQRAWIEEKEAAAKEAGEEYEGGSFASVSYNDTLATLTIERCEELIEYLK